MAIGHVRYSTTGGGSWENAQPVWRDDGRELALAHNGNLINAVELWAELKERGRRLPRHLGLGDHRRAALHPRRPATIEDAVADVMPRLAGRLLDGGDDQATRSSPSATRTGCGRSRSAGSATASSSPPRAAPSTSSAPSCCARSSPGEMVSLTERGLETRQVVKAERPAHVRLRAHLLLPPRQPPRGQGPAAGARAGWARSSGARRRSRPTW